MTYNVFKKILVIGIIILFIEASIVPVIVGNIEKVEDSIVNKNAEMSSILDNSSWQWAISAGGNLEDWGWSVSVDSNGNPYVTGEFEGTASFGSTVLTSSGSSDVFVAKMDTNGNWQWATGAGGGSIDRGMDICVDSDGNSYVTGDFEGEASFGSTVLTTNGWGDIFVAKLDTNGNWQWAKHAGGPWHDCGVGISVDSDGNSYVTGVFDDNASFGDIVLTSSDGWDVFVAKLDTNGNWQWAKQGGGDSCWSISLDSARNSYITGNFWVNASFGSTVLTSSGSSDVFVAKLDTNGNWQWAKQAGGSGSDDGVGISVDSDGNSYVTGDFWDTASFGSTVLTSSGWGDIFVAKLDTNGNWQWAKQGGGADHDQSFYVSADSNGNSYITGGFRGTGSFGGSVFTSSGDWDVFVAKLDTNGNWQWAISAGGNLDDRGWSVSADSNWGPYVTGKFRGTASFGSTVLTSSGSSDVFVAKLDENYWTLMIYLDADNDLHDYGLYDINEMEVAGSSNTIQIIVLFDGRGYGNSVLYRITKDPNGYNSQIVSKILDDQGAVIPQSGEVNMGTPNTIIDFVTWAITKYPANRYCLIFWDHGSGWRQNYDWKTKHLCVDETDGDALELDELWSALNLITDNGNNPIDFIGFDACLMQMIEVGHEIRSYGEYMTGSEEVEPRFGWKYDDTLTTLIESPSMPPSALGAQFVNDYINAGGHTLSTINLELLDYLREDVSNLGTCLQKDEYRCAIHNAINDVEKYDYSDYVDLYHFAQLLKDYIDDNDVDTYAQAVMDEIENVVTTEKHNPNYANSHGLSIYINESSFDQDYKDLLFALDSQWDEFLEWYDQNEPPFAPNIDGPTNGKVGVEYDYNFVTTEPEEQDIYYYIDWGDGIKEEWIGPFSSGEQVTRSHKWTKQGTYIIRIKAKDDYCAESDWAELKVTMPRARLLSNTFFIRLFERFPNLFPILQKILLLQR
jgi:hypothetical protein